MSDADTVIGMRLPPERGLPRDEAFSIDLKGGTGGITAMWPCDDFLEVYKPDATFRIQTPESIDPERTNPHAPYVLMLSDTVGSSNPIIARVMLQSRDILSAAVFTKTVDKEQVARVLHAIKESLVASEKAANRVVAQVDADTEKLKTHGAPRDSRGKFVSPLPQVKDLQSEATSFLINAKRAIQNICGLVPLFVAVDRKDNNFDRLEQRLAKTLGADAPLTRFVHDYAPGTRYLVTLRNLQEHPESKRRTHIDNFRVMPDASIVQPMWYVTGETPVPIRDEMFAAIDFLTETAEWMLIVLVMAAVDSRYPYVIAETPDAELRPENPIKYRLTFDMTKFPLPPAPSPDEPDRLSQESQ